MTLPRVPQDLALAPVAVAIDLNLQTMRDHPSDEMEATLELELDRPERSGTRKERADRILQAATRNVDLHGWHVGVTDDGARIRLSGGSVTLDLGLSASMLRFIDAGG